VHSRTSAPTAGSTGAAELPATSGVGDGLSARPVQRLTGDAIWTLTVLSIIFIFSLLVRYLITMLVPQMKATLALSDFQIGLALGPAFSFSYALFSLPFGWAADRFSRRWILLVGTLLFGLATITTGIAGGFVTLLLSRMLVGIGESSLGPASSSLLAAKYPRKRLATAISVYMTGVKIGTAAAYGVAGVGLTVAAGLIASRQLHGIAPWQMLMIMSGIPALFLAGLMLSVREPDRPAPRPGETPERILAFVRRERALLIPMIAAFSLMALCSNSITGWAPTYITRQFGWTPAAYGPVLGLTSIGAAATLVFKGMLVDWLYQRGIKDIHVRFYSWLVAGSLPLAAALFLVTNPIVFMILFALVSIVAIPVTSYAATVMQVITPQSLRGQMAAITAFFMLSIGGLGPSVVATLTDYVFRDEALLGRSLECVMLVLFPLTLLFLRMSLAPLRRRVLSVEATAD